MTTVLFIGGFGRSGSTLFEAALGSSPATICVGELKFLWSRGVQGNYLCSCGTPFADCSFWQQVLTNAFGPLSPAEVARIEALRLRVDKTRHLLLRDLLGVAKRSYEADIAAYLDILDRLYGAIATTAGASHIVDSSKDPAHGFLINRLSSHNVQNIQLVRDPRAVAYSWSQTKKRPEIHWEEATMPTIDFMRSSLLWRTLNTGMERLISKYGGRCIRYEDFAADPGGVIAELATALNLPGLEGFHSGMTAFEQSEHHSVSGNPSRFDGSRTVTVREDDRWKSAYAKSKQRMVAWLTGSMRGRYGYG